MPSQTILVEEVLEPGKRVTVAMGENRSAELGNVNVSFSFSSLIICIHWLDRNFSPRIVYECFVFMFFFSSSAPMICHVISYVVYSWFASCWRCPALTNP